MSAHTRSARRTTKKRNWAVRLLLVAFTAFLFIKLVQVHVQMEDKQQELIDQKDSIYKYTLFNEDLKEQLANANADADEYLERQANEAGLYLPGQQIYQSTAG